MFCIKLTKNYWFDLCRHIPMTCVLKSNNTIVCAYAIEEVDGIMDGLTELLVSNKLIQEILTVKVIWVDTDKH